jgi:alpha-glucoside transport system permease protein
MAVTARSEQPGLSRFLLPIGGLIALGLVLAGLLILLDPHGGANLLAKIYDALGNSSGATDLENGQGDQVLAKLILAVIALGVGVGGIWLLYLGVGGLVGLMRPSRRDRILPWVFVGPAIALLAVYLLYPAAATVIRSFLDQNGAPSSDNYAALLNQAYRSDIILIVVLAIVAIAGSIFVGRVVGGRLERAGRARAKFFTYLPVLIVAILLGLWLFLVGLAPDFSSIFTNNALWLIVGTAGSVLLGLVIAGLFDRVRREALAKTFIFLPLAISLVGATVIWQFVYAWQPAGTNQIGLLNAIISAFGGQPISFFTTYPVNVFAEIVILVWLQTGFAMVVLSAAIKGVSTEVIEAARLDGASERQLFFGIIVPMIRGSIITVATTIAIVTLKVFDIVYSSTGGRFGDDVVAVRMFHEMFVFANDGRGAALATILFLAVLPVMYVNLRNFRRQQVEG